MPNKFFDQTIVGTPESAVDFIGSILESSTEYSVIGKDLDGKILMWNAGARRFYGYEAEEIVGMNSRVLHTPEDVAAGKPQEMLDAALRDGNWEGMVRRRRKDGSQFMASVVITPRRDADGKPVGFLLMSKEVSGKRAVAEVPHSESVFDSAILGAAELDRVVNQLGLQRTALDTAVDAILITDAQGVILWVNPAFSTTTGYTAEEAIGKTPRILKSGHHDDQFFKDFWQTLNSGRMWCGEFVNQRKDGTIYYDEHTVTPVSDSDNVITHFVAVMHDVTARRRSDEQLREAHAQMRTLLNRSPAVIYALTVDGEKIIPRLSSGNMTRLLGFEIEETLSFEWWSGQLHPEDRARAEAAIKETLKHGFSSAEYRLRHKDGTYRWVDDHQRLVPDSEGKPTEVVGVWTDITDRRRAQDALHENERRFNEMHNNLELASMMLDRDARITYCNDFFLRLTGWHREEVVGCDWFERFVPHEQIAGLREEFTALLDNAPESWHHTNEVLARSGERRLVQWNNSVLRSTSGEVVGTASIGEDITSTRLAERELRRSEEQLRIIIEASTDSIWEWWMETGAVQLSDRAYSTLGITRATFQSTFEAFLTLVHPDDVGTFQQEIKQHLDEDKPFRVRLRLRHSDGSFIPILARGQVQRETGRMVGTFTDLSSVERAEKQILEQAALIDQARDAITVRDLDDRITFWSKGAERLYGWPAGEAVGRGFRELLQVDQAEFQAATKTALHDGGWIGEFDKMTSAGHPVIVDCSWTLLRDDQGRPKSIFSIDTNITDRKMLEKQALRAQRLESLGTLASGIAHDLNNLLMPIVMGASLLKRLKPDERSLKVIGNIERSVKRGTDLVKQVLLFASGTGGVRTAVNLGSVVAEVEAIAASTFPKNITMEISLPDALKSVIGDETELIQVLLNLCVNARDAMPDGGLIAISAVNSEIDLQYAAIRGGTAAGRYVVLEIADNGSGIPKEVMDRIFEPFFTTKDVGAGTGLGLSTVQGIVRSYGGFVEVASEPGRGSAFRVYLPANSEAASTSVEAELQQLPHGRGETILVVDDEAPILSITRQTLEAFGYAVLTAEDGPHAIGIYAREQSRIAAVVTDMEMPIMGGAALIAALRRMNPAILVIAASGHTGGNQSARVASAGAIHYLSKPYSAEVLLRTLSEVLGGAIELRSAG